MMTSDERRELVRLAREHLFAQVMGAPAPPLACEGALAEPGAAFVTVRRRGELRGCLGHLELDAPLGHIVARLARIVTHADPRFPPVGLDELAEIEVEVSVLGPLERVRDPLQEIEVGRHGLVVQQGLRKGLLLPQVALEWGWDCESFLEHTCLKAGLDRAAWRRGAEVFRFEADVIEERARGLEEPAG